MNKLTLFIYLAMYLYGFGLIFWALFYDKHPTKTSLLSAKFGLVGLLLTLIYFFYVIFFIGILE